MKNSVEDFLHEPFYWGLFKGLYVQEIKWLLGDDPLNSLFVYSHATRSVERATFAVPWPVLFLFRFRYKKHRFIVDKLPGLEAVVRNVGEAMNKIRWRAFFKNSEDRGRKCPRALLFPYKCARFCKPSKPEVHGICYSLSNRILIAAWTPLIAPWATAKAVIGSIIAFTFWTSTCTYPLPCTWQHWDTQHMA